jgi:hypothetical protein
MQAPEAAKAKPQKKERIRRVRWVAPDRALAVLSYKNSRKILSKAIEVIKRI